MDPPITAALGAVLLIEVHFKSTQGDLMSEKSSAVKRAPTRVVSYFEKTI